MGSFIHKIDILNAAMNNRLFISGRLFFFLVCMYPAVAPCQNKWDSLVQILQKPSLSYEDRMEATAVLGKEYAFNKPDSSLLYLGQALTLTEQKKDYQRIAKFTFYAGNSLLVKSQYDTALRLYSLILKIDSNQLDKKLLSAAHSKLGVTYWYKGDYSSALQYHSQSLAINKELREDRLIANDYNNIGIVYDRWGNFPMAVSFHIKALEIRENLQDKPGIATSLINIALLHQAMKDFPKAFQGFFRAKPMVLATNDKAVLANLFTNLGQTHYLVNQFDSALYYQEQSLRIRRELGNSVGISACLHRLGLIQLKTKNFNEALRNNLEALQIQSTIGDKPGVATTLTTLAEIYRKSGNLEQSRLTALKALSVSDSIGALQVKQAALEQLVNTLKEMNDFYRALSYQTELLAVRDSLLNKEKANQVASLQAQFESERRASEIQLLQNESKILSLTLRQQRVWRWALGTGLLMALIILLVLYNRFMLKKKANKTLEEKNALIEEKDRHLEKSLREKELLLKEIHHRVKNNLQTVSSLLNLQSRTFTDQGMTAAIKESQSRVKSMALIHQKLYQNEDISTIDFQEYTQDLISYLFNMYDQQKNIRYEIEPFSVNLDVDTAVPLGLILNELVSNSLKHAFTDLEEGLIQIAVESVGDGKLRLEVSDNGRGFPAGFNQEKATSMGLRLVKSLSRQLQADLTVRSENGILYQIDFKAA